MLGGAEFDARQFVYGYLFVLSCQLATHFLGEWYDYEADANKIRASRWTGGSKMLVSGRSSVLQCLMCALISGNQMFGKYFFNHNFFHKGFSDERPRSTSRCWVAYVYLKMKCKANLGQCRLISLEQSNNMHDKTLLYTQMMDSTQIAHDEIVTPCFFCVCKNTFSIIFRLIFVIYLCRECCSGCSRLLHKESQRCDYGPSDYGVCLRLCSTEP